MNFDPTNTRPHPYASYNHNPEWPIKLTDAALIAY